METIESLKKQLFELQQKIYKSEKDDSDGYPPTGEHVYWVDFFIKDYIWKIQVTSRKFDRNNQWFRELYKAGFVYTTKEEAEYWMERQAALVILRNEAKRCWEKYSNDRIIKYYLCYVDNKREAASFLFEASAIATDMPYFPTAKDAVLAMELLGDKEKYFRRDY